jgi:hypothetical protein
MNGLIVRKLIVDEHNELFDAVGMKYLEFPSEFRAIRSYCKIILKGCPAEFLEDNLLEQQLSEIIKNGVKHGNKNDPNKKIKIWYDLRKRVRFIIEDEGSGFTDLDGWNEFYRKRQEALHKQDFDLFLSLASYRGSESNEDDGGNSLIAALEFWNGGIIYNERKNKVGVVRWFPRGSGAAKAKG